MTVVLTDQQFTPQRFRNEKNKWENLPVRNGFFVNTNLKENLDNYYIAAVKANWDGVMLMTGMEGSGKSTTAFTVAKYCDPTFPGELLNDGTTRRSCDRIVFTTGQFKYAVEHSKQGQAIVWDEFILGGFASDALSQMQKELIKLMVTIRKKNLYIILVVPNIFLLRKYFVIARSRALIHHYTPDGIKRGLFKFYSYDSKRILYIKGCKEWDMGASKCDFKGETINTSGYFFDGEQYEAKKDEAIKEMTEAPKKDKEEKTAKQFLEQNRFNRFLLYVWEYRTTRDVNYSREQYRADLKEEFNITLAKSTLRDRLASAIEKKDLVL